MKRLYKSVLTLWTCSTWPRISCWGDTGSDRRILIKYIVLFAFDSHITWCFKKYLGDLGSLLTLQFFNYAEYFYREHRGWSGKRRLRWRLRLYVRWTRLWSDCVFVAAEYILANNAQLLYAGSPGGWLQYRRLELPMGNWRYFWNESVANISRRLSDAFLSSSQQLSRIRGVHEDSERPAVVSKQLSWVSGIFLISHLTITFWKKFYLLF